MENSWVAGVGGEITAMSLSAEDPRLLEYIERKSYLIALDPETDLDIPPAVADMAVYRATLAHKTNHWFIPNCYFGWAVHPVHGKIRSLNTIRYIKQGEELTVDYDYAFDGIYTPDWYKKLYKKFMK